MKFRQAIVKIIRPDGQIKWVENITLNEKNRITDHNDSVNYEGPDGLSFDELYKNVEQVNFTGRLHENKEVVEVYVSVSWDTDKIVEDFEAVLV